MNLLGAALIGILISFSSCQRTPKLTCYSSKSCRGSEVNVGQSGCCVAGGGGLSFMTTLNGTCQECYGNETFTAEGSKFFLGIFANPSQLYFFRIGKFRLAVSPVRSSQVDFIVNASGVPTDYTAPIEVSMDAATVSVDSDGVRDRAIVIKSTNNDPLSVVAYAEEFTSLDTFKLLPCVNLPVRVYEYYAVSVPLAQVPVDWVEDDYESDEKFESPQGNSTIVIVTSEQSTQVNITLTQNVSITAPDLLQQIPGGKFEAGVPATVLLPSKAQTLLIYSLNDLTGSRIMSNKPISLISGHQCGTIPENVNFCDHMAEQIPPTATWGKTFVTSAIAGRTSFDIFKAIASQSNTVINISCINGQGQNFQQIQLQQSGQFENINVSSGSACYITSTRPILLVQFSVASTLDRPYTFRGDPFMVVVPPVEQYRTSYIIDTLQATAIPGVISNEVHYINVMVPEGVDREGLHLNGTVLEASFMSIPCDSNIRNGPSCGMAATIQVPIGRHNLTHTSGAIFNAISYTLSFRAGAGYFAGMTQFPTALPRISFSKEVFEVFENQSFAAIEIIRSGDLSGAGSCPIHTLQLSTKNAAHDVKDFSAMNTSIAFLPQQRQIVLHIPLTNDIFPEAVEEFEVYLSTCPGVLIDYPAYTTVRILNDDSDLPAPKLTCYSSKSCRGSEVNVRQSECCVAGGGGLSFMTTLNGTCQECYSNETFTAEGSTFFFGIFANPSQLPFFRIGKFRLAVSPVRSSQVDFIVNASGVPTDYTAPIEVSMDAATVSVDSDGVRDRAIVIESTNNDPLSVVAYAEEFTSSDTFKPLPCVNLPVRVYEYYAVSVPLAQVPVDRVEDDYESDKEFESPQGNSTIVIVTSEQSTQVNITLTQNVSITAPDLLQQIPGGKFEAGVPATVLLPSKAQTLLIYSLNDLTGSRITSNKPISLISGHQCGTVPENVNFCDHMAEQIPPTATWGKTFVTSAIAGRTSFDIFKAIASQSNTVINISCINSQGQNFQQIQLQQSGQFENINVSSGSACYITSTCPILLVQFSVASTLDKPSTFRGDPFMVVIPPVEQYRTSYIVDTLQATAILGVTINGVHYINVMVPEGVDREGLHLNGTVLEASFMSIPCDSNIRNGPSCGMSAQIRVPIGRHNLTHTSGAIFNAISYTLAFRAGAGYFAGMTQFPTALPRISFSKEVFEVFENQSFAAIDIIRSGDLSGAGSCPIHTLQLSTKNAAHDVKDFSAMNTSIAFLPQQRQIVLHIPLTNDIFPEAVEEFEVYLSACPGVFIDCPAYTTVRILNDDSDLPVMTISFADVIIEVAEGDCMVSFILEKTRGAVGPVSVQIATNNDGTSRGGADYIDINETVTFQISDISLPVVVFVLDDEVLEDVENFTASLVPVPGLFPVAVGDDMATVTIVDNDLAVIGFSQLQYSTEEFSREVVITVELLHGTLASSIEILLLTSDGTAKSGSDYSKVSTHLTFDPFKTSISRSLTIIDDNITEGIEFLKCILMVSPQVSRVLIPQNETIVTIVDNDVVFIGLHGVNPVVREDEENSKVNISIIQGVLSEPVTLRLLAVNIDAKGGDDFIALNRTVIVGDSSVLEVCVGIIDDSEFEGDTDERFMLLATVEGGQDFKGKVILQPNSVIFAIEDNDFIHIGFKDSLYSVSEDAGKVTLLVKSDVMDLKDVNVEYFYLNGTAQDGTDVVVGSGSLLFSPGSMYARVSIPITDDSLTEANEVFTVRLRSLGGSAILLPAKRDAVVTILDDDAVVIGFDNPHYNVEENVTSGSATVQVAIMEGELLQSVAVTLQTLDAIALDGADYRAITPTLLTFNESINSFNVTVFIINDNIKEINEKFILFLNVTGKDSQVKLLNSQFTTVNILDDD